MNTKSEYTVPVTDILETDNNYSVKMEMPGVTKENLNIFIENEELEIRGKISQEHEGNLKVKYSEFESNDFYRKFKIGTGIDKNSIKAELENGVLTLNIKKREEVQPKKIKVNVS